jgi:predicted aspartyl protease
VRRFSIYQVQRWQDLLWVKAAVGDTEGTVIKVRLLVDTGASFTSLPTKITSLIGVASENSPKTRRVTAGNGVIVAPVVVIPWFNCLGQRIENFPVMAHTLPPVAFVDGLLGMDFLQRYRAKIGVAEAEIQVESEE